MLSNFLEIVIPEIIHLLEAMGVIIIFIGAIKAFWKYFCNLIKGTNYPIKIQFCPVTLQTPVNPDSNLSFLSADRLL